VGTHSESIKGRFQTKAVSFTATKIPPHVLTAVAAFSQIAKNVLLTVVPEDGFPKD
jgi:hypothetical protein